MCIVIQTIPQKISAVQKYSVSKTKRTIRIKLKEEVYGNDKNQNKINWKTAPNAQIYTTLF